MWGSVALASVGPAQVSCRPRLFFGGWAQVTASGYSPKVKGDWKYLYRAVDRLGKIVEFLLTAKRDMVAAKRFFDKALGANGVPDNP